MNRRPYTASCVVLTRQPYQDWSSALLYLSSAGFTLLLLLFPTTVCGLLSLAMYG